MVTNEPMITGKQSILIEVVVMALAVNRLRKISFFI